MKRELFKRLGSFYIYYHLPFAYSLGQNKLGKLFEFYYNSLGHFFNGQFLNLTIFIQLNKGFLVYWKTRYNVYKLFGRGYKIGD